MRLQNAGVNSISFHKVNIIILNSLIYFIIHTDV